MHFIQFITIVVLATGLSACQLLENSRTDPEATEPMAPVAAEMIRETIPEQAPPSASADGPAPSEGPQEAGEDDSAEPAATAAADEVPPAPTDLWHRIREGFRLDHHLDKPRVQAELDWYRRHPAYLDRVAERASRHLYHIVEAIEARDMPTELALLPIVESAFDPFAYSHGRAAGLWQFIPGTARMYDLKIDWWYDGRRDVPAATNAAIRYLDNLYTSLDEDWLLALAAYNSGEGNVRKSLRRNRRSDKSTDFWSLELLRETRAYVPRLLAISALVAEPERYGIELATIPDEAEWESVEIGSQLDLARAAELADISTETLYLYNPAFNRWSTHPEGPHRLLIPMTNVEQFKQNLDALPDEQRVAWQRHQIRNGESLGIIAQRYGTSIDAIKIANNLKGNTIIAGKSLLIPVATSSSDAYTLSESGRLKRAHESLEDRHGEPTRYTVRPGDSFWEISQKFGVPVRQLARWNGMAPTDVLLPDTELVLFVASAPQVAMAPARNEVIRRVHYRVRQGESLSLIAAKFNLSVGEIRKWNTKLAGRKYLQPGDRLTLYVDVTALH